MTYVSTVSADSPWGFWTQYEGSTVLFNSGSSGADHDLYISGSPTLRQPSPDGGTSASFWGSGSDYAYTSSNVVSNRTAATFECWFYLPSVPQTPTSLVSAAYGIGDTSRRPLHLWVDTNGTINARWGSSNASYTVISSSNTVSTGVWHHVALKIGSGTGAIRLDGVDVATGSQNLGLDNSAFLYLHTGGVPSSGGENLTNGDTVSLAYPAVWWTKLSDTVTDGHYTAMATADPPVDVDISVSSTHTSVLITDDTPSDVDVSSIYTQVLLGVSPEAPADRASSAEHLKTATSLNSYPIQVSAESLIVSQTGVEDVKMAQGHVKSAFPAVPGNIQVSAEHIKILNNPKPDNISVSSSHIKQTGESAPDQLSNTSEKLSVAHSGVESVDVTQAHTKTVGSTDRNSQNTESHAKILSSGKANPEVTSSHTKVLAEIKSTYSSSTEHVKTAGNIDIKRKRGWGILL